jgi:Trk-type K+ transport system membrane component
MPVGSMFLLSVGIPHPRVAAAVDEPLSVFEVVSAYGSVGLSLGLPTVSPPAVGFRAS